MTKEVIEALAIRRKLVILEPARGNSGNAARICGGVCQQL